LVCTGYYENSYNKLTTLDVSKNTALERLECEQHKLTSLDLSKNTALKSVDISTNNFSSSALNSLFGTLHSNVIPNKEIRIGQNPGTNTCDESIATKKGWKVK